MVTNTNKCTQGPSDFQSSSGPKWCPICLPHSLQGGCAVLHKLRAQSENTVNCICAWNKWHLLSSTVLPICFILFIFSITFIFNLCFANEKTGCEN